MIDFTMPEYQIYNLFVMYFAFYITVFYRCQRSGKTSQECSRQAFKGSAIMGINNSRLLLDARASRIRETLTPRKGDSINMHPSACNQARVHALLINTLRLIAQTASI